MRYERCRENSARVTCNCAIAIQSGEDIFIADMCRVGVRAGTYKSNTSSAR